MASYTFYGDSADGDILMIDADWADVQAGSGGPTVDTSSTTFRVGKQKGVGNYSNYLAGLAFDTSALPDDAEITAATLTLTAAATASRTWTLEARDYNWGTSLTSADYRTSAQWSALTLLAQYDLAGGWASNSAYALTSYGVNLANLINKTGTTYLMLGSSEYPGIAPATIESIQVYSANETGTSRDPKLEVTTFEPPAFTPQVMWIN